MSVFIDTIFEIFWQGGYILSPHLTKIVVYRKSAGSRRWRGESNENSRFWACKRNGFRASIHRICEYQVVQSSRSFVESSQIFGSSGFICGGSNHGRTHQSQTSFSWSNRGTSPSLFLKNTQILVRPSQEKKEAGALSYPLVLLFEVPLSEISTPFDIETCVGWENRIQMFENHEVVISVLWCLSLVNCYNKRFETSLWIVSISSIQDLNLLNL